MEDRSSKLEKLCKTVISLPQFLPGYAGRTHCNEAISFVFTSLGYSGLNKLLIGDQITWARESGDFNILDGLQASVHALNGFPSFAAKDYKLETKEYEPGSGHGAIVFPSPLQWSYSMKAFVPMIANVGKKNAIMRVTEGFPVSAGLPEYFALKRNCLEKSA